MGWIIVSVAAFVLYAAGRLMDEGEGAWVTVRTYTEAEVEELLRRQVRRFSWWLLGSVTVACLLVATVAALTARAASAGSSREASRPAAESRPATRHKMIMERMVGPHVLA